LFNLFLTFAVVRRLNTQTQTARKTGLEAGQPAPNFTAITLSGEVVTRSTYAGRKTGLVFIGTHCGPCHEILPDLEALQPKAARASIEFTLVSIDSLDETRAFVEQHNVTLPVLVAPRATNSFMHDYQSDATPSYCFIDEQGIVQSAGYPSLYQGTWKALDNWATAATAVVSKRR
jgi:peroxiredoxin